MKRYILTGTPGSGKTAILHELKSQGYGVLEEAATEVIAPEQRRGHLEPHLRPDFIDAIVRLQKQRQREAALLPSDPQWYDRSPICTLALSRYLVYLPSASLVEELERIERERIYQRVLHALFQEKRGHQASSLSPKLGMEPPSLNSAEPRSHQARA